MKLNIHYYQHVNHEGLASIQKWVDGGGHNLTKTNFKNNDPIPNPDLYDVLIVLGGPMSVNDSSQYPWLNAEKKSIDRALNDGKKVLGICLGAQLLAEVLGSKVYKNIKPEIGWHDITFNESRNNFDATKHFPEVLRTFHWHSETFDLANGCTLIASSDACQNQIFAYGDIAFGFQCHPEQNEYSIGRMIQRSGVDLISKDYVQSSDEILSGIHLADINNKLLFTFLDSFFEI